VCANKKKPGQAPIPDESEDDPRDTQAPRQPKAISFEDLLREIQGEKTLSRPVEPKAVVQKPAKEYDFVDYDDDIPDEVEEYEKETTAANDERAFQAYEAAKRDAYQKPQPVQKIKTENLDRLEHFKGYDQRKKKKITFDFLSELKDPKGFRKAFIMSEILNKKY
jgi:hypothetical protein